MQIKELRELLITQGFDHLQEVPNSWHSTEGFTIHSYQGINETDTDDMIADWIEYFHDTRSDNQEIKLIMLPLIEQTLKKFQINCFYDQSDQVNAAIFIQNESLF